MSLLFPSRCIFCSDAVSEAQCGVCADCLRLAEAEMRTLFCTPPDGIDALICAGRYRGSLRSALLRVKHNPAGLLPIAGLMARAWELHAMPMPEVITCVPMNRWKEARRGFNQSGELARALSECWRIPYQRLLTRGLFSQKQSRLNAAQRQQNASRSFAAAKRTELHAKTVVLIDDIVTTGSTTAACAEILREMGAETVWVLAAAKT